MKCLLILFLSFLYTISSFSQAEEFLKIKQKYPNESMATLSSERYVEISLDDDGINISQEVFEEDILLNDNAKYATKQSVDYNTFFQLEDIEASSFIFEGNRYKEYKVRDFTEKDEITESFYDDVKTVNFLYPKLEPGAKKQLKYKMNIKNPRFLNPFYFAASNPVLKSKMVIEVDEDINLDFKEFNTENVNIKRGKENKRGKNIYTWEVDNIESFEFEGGAPSYKTVLPHIIPVIKNYRKDDKTINLLSNTKDLYNWYFSLVENVNTASPDIELVAIVNGLIKDKTSDLEKVRAIYYWAQENIKYIDFEFALGGFVPREANDVFNKKYGDCKDNSSIMLEMLEIAGIKGELTWIGTRDIPYKYDEVPTPAVDNHMILSYQDGEDTYFLDATGRYVPLGMPTSFIQGKEALMANGKEAYKIVDVPVVPASKNAHRDSLVVSIEDRTLVGKGTAEFSGYYKIDLYNYLESKNSRKDLLEFYNLNLRKGSNSFLISDFNEVDKYDYDKNFKIGYNFTVKDYCNTASDEVYINLNLDKSITDSRIKEDRKQALEMNYKASGDLKIALNIPEGKTVDYLPENTVIKSPLLDISISYSQTDSQVIYEYQSSLKTLIIEKEDQKAYNDIINQVEKAFKEVVVLK